MPKGFHSTAAQPSEVRPGSAEVDLAKLLEPYLVVRKVKAGVMLWEEGDAANQLVVVSKGHFQALRYRPGGRQVPLFLFGPGDVFGFLPLLDGQSYPATVRALEDSEILGLSRNAMASALREHEDLALDLLRILGRRLREALTRVEAYSHKEALARVAGGLLGLMPWDGPVKGITIIQLPGSAKAFAEDLGVAPETLSRALARLIQTSLLHRLGPRRFQVLDAAGLRMTARSMVW